MLPSEAKNGGNVMKRLTFDGNFCDIAQCKEFPCPYNGSCSQREVWEKLKAYEATGLEPAVCANYKTFEDEAISKGVPFKRIVALMEADRDGRLVVLPCKVGDRLYEVTGRKTISVYEVRAIRVELFGLFIEWDIVEGFAWQSLAGINAREIGKTVFLTREAAEKALEAMKDG